MIIRRHFTLEDDLNILTMRKEGKSYGEIGLAIAREKTSVAYREKILVRKQKTVELLMTEIMTKNNAAAIEAQGIVKTPEDEKTELRAQEKVLDEPTEDNDPDAVH